MAKEIKNLKKAANRILEAVKNKEKIILYGDADPDGVGSVIILKESLETLGGRICAIYFPDREKEGYGLNEKALNILKRKSPALLIVLDCAMSDVREVDLAKKMGFEVIIIDHHEVLHKIPRASIIVNPKQKRDKYPFKELACIGVVYKLVKDLFWQAGQGYNPERFLELVMLATLADQMPIEDENKKFIQQGLLALNFTQRKGLKALIKLTHFKNGSQGEVRQKLLVPLNIFSSIGHLNEAYLLLIEENLEKAKKIAKNLIKKVQLKRIELRRIFEEAEEKIRQSSEKIIFEGDEAWPLVFLGPVASRVCQKYKKPTFLFKKGKTESPGSVRTPSGINGVKAMTACKSLLKTYGGHPQAGGFRIKNENLEDFKECLIKYFKNL